MDNKKPLVISINGGLGNQFFMLFAGMSKAKDENRDYLIYLENNKRPYYFDSIMKQFYNKVINYNNIQVNVNNIYQELNFHYDPIPDNCDLIKGYYQSYKYFENNYDYLREEFKINELKQLYKFNFKTIGIHFRLGDFVELTHFNLVLSFIYYIKAIKYLKEKLSDFDEYTIIIFGEKANDDMINQFLFHINKNLDKPIYSIKIYEKNPNSKDYEEMFYMSNCEHLIIANSTFSWFGAYFNDNDNNIIIHPSRTKWFASEVINNYNFKDLFPEKWIEIDY